jgi:hypothetical protein
MRELRYSLNFWHVLAIMIVALPQTRFCAGNGLPDCY